MVPLVPVSEAVLGQPARLRVFVHQVLSLPISGQLELRSWVLSSNCTCAASLLTLLSCACYAMLLILLPSLTFSSCSYYGISLRLERSCGSHVYRDPPGLLLSGSLRIGTEVWM